VGVTEDEYTIVVVSTPQINQNDKIDQMIDWCHDRNLQWDTDWMWDYHEPPYDDVMFYFADPKNASVFALRWG